MYEIIIGLKIIAIVYFFNYDSFLTNSIRYKVKSILNKLPVFFEEIIFSTPKKRGRILGDLVVEEEYLQEITVKEFISSMIFCGYCLTFHISWITLLLLGYKFESFLLAFVFAFCYKILESITRA